MAPIFFFFYKLYLICSLLVKKRKKKEEKKEEFRENWQSISECTNLSIVELRVHDDHEVCSEVEAPGKVAGHDHHLDGACLKQLLN